VSFPELALFPLAWIGLVPYLYFLLNMPSWPVVLLGHGILVLAYFGGVLYWIPDVLVLYGGINWLVAWVLLLLLVLLLGLFLLPFSLMVRWTAGKSPRLALLSAPGFWIVTELCRNYWMVNGFPWALLGYTQYPYSWITQIADIGGVYLVSLLVVAGNCALVGMLFLNSLRPIVLFGILFVISNVYGAYRTYMWAPVEGTPINVALVQPNIELFGNSEHYASKYFETLPDYYRRAVAEGAGWVIFPEAPNPYRYEKDFYFREFWQREIGIHRASLLLNSTVFEEPSSYFNSVLLLDSGGEPSYRYDKTHLVPFGEYIPFGGWVRRWFEPLVQEVGEFTPGKRIQSGTVMGVSFATLICFEGIFPELSRAFVDKGAQVLVNITNDTWYGRSAAPRQHLQMAAFRAVENRKPYLRCANSGYSAVINHLGKIEQSLGLFEEGLLITRVAGNNYRTVYSYTGDLLNISISIVAFVLALVARFGRSRSQKLKRRR